LGWDYAVAQRRRSSRSEDGTQRGFDKIAGRRFWTTRTRCPKGEGQDGPSQSHPLRHSPPNTSSAHLLITGVTHRRNMSRGVLAFMKWIENMLTPVWNSQTDPGHLVAGHAGRLPDFGLFSIIGGPILSAGGSCATGQHVYLPLTPPPDR
jgi:hypothetical protein